MSLNTTIIVCSVDLDRSLSNSEVEELNQLSDFFHTDSDGYIRWNGNTRFDVDGKNTLRDEVMKVSDWLTNMEIDNLWEVSYTTDSEDNESGMFEVDDYGIVNDNVTTE